ncbi:MAG: hypothetical protein LBC64_00920 [Fibromonadaceae bacterium]|nr:hypothetical protein [Fibromonadaceae bacterium]
MTEIKTNRNHKASVFSLLFGEPPAALELYNAVTGQNYPPDTKIEIVTLSNVLFKGQLNDVAFVMDTQDAYVSGSGMHLSEPRFSGF